MEVIKYRDHYLEKLLPEIEDLPGRCMECTGFTIKNTLERHDTIRPKLLEMQYYQPVSHSQKNEKIISNQDFYQVQPSQDIEPESLVKRIQDVVVYLQLLLERLCREKSLSDLDDLKGKLEQLCLILEKIVFFYTCSNEQENDVDIQSVIKLKDDMLRRLNGMTLSNLSLDFPEENEDSLICAYLGLNEFVQKSFKKQEDEIRAHRTLIFWIHNFMDNQYYERMKRGLDNFSMKEQLRFLGFSKNRAQFLELWLRDKNIFSHRTLLFWSKLYIEIELELFRPNLYPMSFPFGNTINQWFGERVEVGLDEGTININCKNILFSTSDNLLTGSQASIADSLESDTHIRFLHGTNEQGAANILANGIQLKMGKANLDFSDSFGFYMGRSTNVAINYAKHLCSRNNCIVILVFTIERRFLKECKGRDLSENKELFKKVVHFYRKMPLNGKLQRREPNEVKTVDYIEGPISRTDGYGGQLCIKTQHMADAVSKCLTHALFCKKDNQRQR